MLCNPSSASTFLLSSYHRGRKINGCAYQRPEFLSGACRAGRRESSVLFIIGDADFQHCSCRPSFEALDVACQFSLLV